VIKERNLLLEANGKNGAAATEWDRLLRQLKPRMEGDPAVRRQYFECTCHLVRAYYKYGKGLPEGPKRQAAILKAASYLTALRESYPDLGGDPARARFLELLDQEKELRELKELKGLYEELLKSAPK
jgi:hypothetical protein